MKNIAFIKILMLAALPVAAFAQQPAIVSMVNGQLTAANITTNLTYRLEWAPRLNATGGSNVFRAGYSSVEYITPTGGSVMTIDVPQFYRVAGQSALSNNIFRASDLQLVINASTNQRYTLEWAVTANGPWRTGWNGPQEFSITGSTVVVETPNYYRITYLND